MPPEVFPSLTVRERGKVRWGGERDQKKENEIIIIETRRQINKCRLCKVCVVLEDIQEEVVF